MGTSMGVRPRVAEEGNLRLGFGQGFTRDIARDFAYAEPTNEIATIAPAALLSELSAHYGIAKHMDIGVRVRPMAPGLKLEWQYQLLDPRGDPVGVAVGLGVDGFYRSRLQLDCQAHGCFFREYGGAIAELPIVLSRRTVRWLTLFVAARAELLFMKGQQTYEADDGSFPTLKVKKTVTQPIGGWTAGLLFEWSIVRMIPQVNGVTIRGPDGELLHAIYPSLDFGFEW
jgi:hypothetical protein